MVKHSKVTSQASSLNKRKRGILRKAMELSKMCGVQIYIAIEDPKSKTLTQYASESKIETEQYDNLEVYNSANYEDLESKFTTKKTFEDIQKKRTETSQIEVDSIISRLVPNFGKNANSQKIKKTVLRKESESQLFSIEKQESGTKE